MFAPTETKVQASSHVPLDLKVTQLAIVFFKLLQDTDNMNWGIFSENNDLRIIFVMDNSYRIKQFSERLFGEKNLFRCTKQNQ